MPTAEEAIEVEIVFGGWGGIYAPKGLPDDVKLTLEAAVAAAVESDSYQEFQAGAGNLVVYRDSTEWTSFVEDLGSDENELPQELRANLISIGLWLLREAEEIRQGRSENFEGLIEVSQIIRDGIQ